MSELARSLEAALDEARAALAEAATPAAVDEVRIRMIGRKGLVPAAMKQIGALSAEERPEIGKVANYVKTELAAAIEARLAELKSAARAETASIDVTLPGRRPDFGGKHPLSQVTDQCVAIFRRMGFIVAAGPDIEDEYHNFDALNTPADHPARDEQDTLFLFDGRLLRTQTSTVQVRVMENQEPPVRIVAPGCCYRRDTPDATHSMNFHQLEGLYIDHDVSLAQLKGDMQVFAHEMFGPDTAIRLRPHFFPFTEPSIELDVAYKTSDDAAARWLEVAGAGMVDPNVLAGVGYDPEEWTGYAFGFGIERIAMIKYRIPDIRLLYENDVRFLSQF